MYLCDYKARASCVILFLFEISLLALAIKQTNALSNEFCARCRLHFHPKTVRV